MWLAPPLSLALAALVVVLPARAGVDLVAKRGICLAAARAEVKAPAQTGSQLYRILFERRQAYVRRCMANPEVPAAGAALDPQQTGSSIRREPRDASLRRSRGRMSRDR